MKRQRQSHLMTFKNFKNYTDDVRLLVDAHVDIILILEKLGIDIDTCMTLSPPTVLLID